MVKPVFIHVPEAENSFGLIENKRLFLHSHLDFFPGKLESVSGDHEERFHRDIATIEERYQCKWSTSSLADYCWSLIHDDPIKNHVRSIIL